MGANMSKQPKTELAKMATVVAALCYVLQKVVNEPHNPPKAANAESSSGGASSPARSGSRSSLARTPSMLDMMRSERLSRATQLERSVPRSYRMALESFAKCYVAIGVLDVLFARHSKVNPPRVWFFWCVFLFFLRGFLACVGCQPVAVGCAPEQVRSSKRMRVSSGL